MKIAIIGAGAAGLMAAITAAKAGARVTVFEQNAEAGKKILASGNGRCNIINRDTGLSDFEGEDPRFAAHALNVMDFKSFERFCKSIGLLLEIKADGKCYPLSQEARAVQSALLRAALHLSIRIYYDAQITQVAKQSERFLVQTGESATTFERVIIVTGSPAAPQLGGNASGMEFAKALGHRIIDPFPSLVGLHLDEPALAKMTGVKTEAHVTLNIDGAPCNTSVGDILLTRYGISGFAVLDLSHHASQALQTQAYTTLTIDLLPQFTPQSLAAHIEQIATHLPDDTLYDLLCGLIPHKLIRPILQRHKLPSDLLCRDVNAKTAKKIAYALKQWSVHVTQTHGYKHAEVAGGGIATEEIDSVTMESKIVPGLYFAGEVIDITGHRGGFNFHFAWGSGYLAGLNAAKA